MTFNCVDDDDVDDFNVTIKMSLVRVTGTSHNETETETSQPLIENHSHPSWVLRPNTSPVE